MKTYISRIFFSNSWAFRNMGVSGLSAFSFSNIEWPCLFDHPQFMPKQCYAVTIVNYKTRITEQGFDPKFNF